MFLTNIEKCVCDLYSAFFINIFFFKSKCHSKTYRSKSNHLTYQSVIKIILRNFIVILRFKTSDFKFNYLNLNIYIIAINQTYFLLLSTIYIKALFNSQPKHYFPAHFFIVIVT